MSGNGVFCSARGRRSMSVGLVALMVAGAIGVTASVGAPAAEAADGDVERVSGVVDFASPWLGAGFPVPASPTDPDQARFSVYATKVLTAPGAIYVRDYDTIVKVDPASGVSERVVGYYANPDTGPSYPTIPDGVGQDSLSVGTSWSRSLGLLADGRLIFDSGSAGPRQVFAAATGGGAVEAFAGDGTSALPTPGEPAISTGLDAATGDEGMFGTASGGAWIVGGYAPGFTSYYAHHVAPDGTITTHLLPAASNVRTVVGDDLVTVEVQDVSSDPESPSWVATLYALSPDGTIHETPMSGDCVSASPTASVGVDGGVLRYLGEFETAPTYPFPKVDCSVVLATGVSTATALAPVFDDWASGSDDGTYQRHMESPATWDPATQAWWFVGRTTRDEGGGYSLALYRHRPAQGVEPVQHELAVGVVGAGAGSVTSDPAGIDCGTACAASYAEGAEVTLTAAAEPGSVFDGWTGGGCSGAGPCVLSMDQARSVQAAFSTAPRGSGLIAFSGSTPGAGSELYLLDVGAGTSSVVAGTAGARAPSWSGDGSKVAFGASKGLHVVDTASGSVATVFGPGTLPTLATPGSVSWSPDDQWLVFDASDEIWVVPADGGQAPTQLTADVFADSNPAWSAQGRIAWRTNRSAARVWVAAFDASTVSLVGAAGLANSTSVPSQQREMDWSPDGSALVLSAAVNAALNDDVFVLPTDGMGALRQLTVDPADDATPAWSPDGSSIVFSASRSSDFDLYSIPADGVPGDETPLHVRAGSDLSPDWARNDPGDPPVVIRPAAVGVTEGDSGTVTMEVPVSLSEPSSQPVTVDWATLDTGAPGVATADVDYVAGSGTVTFAPGETQATVSITVNGDTVHEPPLLWGEWLLVAFSNPSANATVDLSFYGLGLGVIVDDD